MEGAPPRSRGNLELQFFFFKGMVRHGDPWNTCRACLDSRIRSEMMTLRQIASLECSRDLYEDRDGVRV